jgi:ABC-type sugar transport system ATPase subunit
MKVREQIGFALTIRKWSRRDVDRRVGELAELMGIAALLDRRPDGLSGGERQRIALARALAANPGVLCLDEPLSALDDATRDEMYTLLQSVREHVGVTTLHITHSRSEARRLGDVIFLIDNGAVAPVSLDDLTSMTEDLSPDGLSTRERVQA